MQLIAHPHSLDTPSFPLAPTSTFREMDSINTAVAIPEYSLAVTPESTLTASTTTIQHPTSTLSDEMNSKNTAVASHKDSLTVNLESPQRASTTIQHPMLDGYAKATASNYPYFSKERNIKDATDSEAHTRTRDDFDTVAAFPPTAGTHPKILKI